MDGWLVVSWKNEPWFCVDVETTGLTAGQDRIVEVAGVWMRQGQVCEAPDGSPGRRATVVNPGIPIPDEASAIHGVTDERVMGMPTMDEVSPRFCAHVQQSTVLVAYNVPFDFGFLMAECAGFADDCRGAHHMDPLTVVREVGRYWPGKGRHKLTAAFRRLGLTLPGDAHRGSSDAIGAGMVLWHLRCKLPDDGADAMALLGRWRVEQERQHGEWLGKMRAKNLATAPAPAPMACGKCGVVEMPMIEWSGIHMTAKCAQCGSYMQHLAQTDEWMALAPVRAP